MSLSFLITNGASEQYASTRSDGGRGAGFWSGKNGTVTIKQPLYSRFEYIGRHGFVLSGGGLPALGDPGRIDPTLRRKRLLGFASTTRPVRGAPEAGLPLLRLARQEMAVIRQICPSVRAHPNGEHLGFNQYYGDLPDEVVDTLAHAVELGLFDQIQIWQEREFGTSSVTQNRVLAVGTRNGDAYLLAGWGGNSPEAVSVVSLARELLLRCETAMRTLTAKKVQEEKPPVLFEFMAIFSMGIIPAALLVWLGWMPMSFGTFDDSAFFVSAFLFWSTAFGVFAETLITWVFRIAPGKSVVMRLDPVWRRLRDPINGQRKRNAEAKAVARLMETGNWRDVSRLAETARLVLASGV